LKKKKAHAAAKKRIKISSIKNKKRAGDPIGNGGSL
jgi:hypothetical protein